MVKFSIADEEKNRMIDDFEVGTNDAQRELELLFEQLQELYLEQRYEPLYLIAERLAKYWNEIVNEDINRRIKTWEDSDSSIASFLREVQAFDSNQEETRKSAEHLQESLFESTNELFRTEIELQPIDGAVSMTQDIEQLFNSMTEYIQNFKTKILNIYDELKEVQVRREEDNNLYSIWGSFVDVVFSTLGSQVEFMERQTEHFGEEIGQLGKSVSSQSSETGAGLSQDAKISALNEMAEDLFDI